jgi:hypothetical protein
LEQIPRDAVTLALRGARLPLTAYELVARRGQDPDEWPPALLFEKVEATVREAVGRVTGDDALVGSARLQRAEVAKRFEAIAKATAAEAAVEEAEREAAERVEDLGERRRAADERAAEKKGAVEEARRRQEAEVAREASAAAEAAREADAARRAQIDRAAKQAEAKRLREEAKALRAKDAAIEKRQEAVDLGSAVQAKKSARAAR